MRICALQVIWNRHGLDGVAVQGKALLILLQFGSHFLDLCSQDQVLVVRRFRRLLKILHLCLKILQMLLLALTERTLRCSVLRFALLDENQNMSVKLHSTGIHTEVGSDVNGFLPGFFAPFGASSCSRLFPSCSSSS